jgi:hypothetical protein
MGMRDGLKGAPAPSKEQGRRRFAIRHCENCEAKPKQDEAIHSVKPQAIKLDCFAALAMTDPPHRFRGAAKLL